MFFAKSSNDNHDLTKVAALLIHAAKIDENYTNLEKEIIKVLDIPRTKSGKIAELTVIDLIHNKEIKNKTALANPECLSFYQNLTELKT